MLQYFGRTIRLEVYESPSFGTPILSTGTLRVDFKMKLMQSFNRAMFSIYNLDPKVIGRISNGDRYVRIWVSVHGNLEQQVGGDFFINNAITEKLVPNSVTKLYCISKGEKDLSQEDIGRKVARGSLKRQIESIVGAKGYKAEFIGFPRGMVDYIPVKPTNNFNGLSQHMLTELGRQYSFTHHMEQGKIVFQFHPTVDNYHLCNWDGRNTVVLQTENLIANVALGVANVLVKSVLDPSLSPTTVVDTSQLETATTQEGFDSGTVVKDYFRDLVSGITKFSILTTDHIGSNFTNKWETNVNAIRITQGKTASPYNFFGEE